MVLGKRERQVLVVEREVQPLSAKATERGSGTLRPLGKSFLASNSRSRPVFGRDVWQLVGHPFLLLCLVGSIAYL